MVQEVVALVGEGHGGGGHGEVVTYRHVSLVAGSEGQCDGSAVRGGVAARGRRV